jgi:putative membrane protein
MLAPIGLVFGAPVTLLLRTMTVANARLLSRALRSRPVRAFTHPVTVLALSGGGPALLYLTPLYQRTLASPALHTVIMVHFLLSGCLFAWLVAGPDPAPHRPPVPLRLLVLGAAIAVHATVSQLLYAGAYVYVPGPAADRQAGATLMYYVGDVAELVLAFAVVRSRTTRTVPAAASAGETWPGRVSRWPGRAAGRGNPPSWSYSSPPYR